MHLATAASSSIIRDRFLADHRRLEVVFETLLDAFEGGVWSDVSDLWTQLESELERHMLAEEKFLIVRLRESNPEDAETILTDHRAIRARLAEFGVGIDLHIIRMTMASKFIDELQKHARLEDKLLYQWGDAHLGERDQASLLSALASKATRRVLRSTR